MNNQNNYPGNDYQDNSYNGGYPENNYPGNEYPGYYPPDNYPPKKKNVAIPIILAVSGVVIIGIIIAIIMLFMGDSNNSVSSDPLPVITTEQTTEAQTEAQAQVTDTQVTEAQTQAPATQAPPPPAPPLPPAIPPDNVTPPSPTIDYLDRIQVYRVYNTFSKSKNRDVGLTLRSGPGTGYSPVKYRNTTVYFFEGAEVGVAGWSGNWAYVTISYGKYGWTNGSSGSKMSGFVNGSYLTPVYY